MGNLPFNGRMKKHKLEKILWFGANDHQGMRFCFEDGTKVEVVYREIPPDPIEVDVFERMELTDRSDGMAFLERLIWIAGKDLEVGKNSSLYRYLSEETVDEDELPIY